MNVLLQILNFWSCQIFKMSICVINLKTIMIGVSNWHKFFFSVSPWGNIILLLSTGEQKKGISIIACFDMKAYTTQEGMAAAFSRKSSLFAFFLGIFCAFLLSCSRLFCYFNLENILLSRVGEKVIILFNHLIKPITDMDRQLMLYIDFFSGIYHL